MSSKKLYFDMDGTVADLYGVPNWLENLRAENPAPYDIAKPIYDMEILQEICVMLQAKGWEIGIITWLSMGASEEYNEKVTKAKRNWAKRNMPYITEFHAQVYGTPKQKAIVGNPKKVVLVDDNAEVRLQWETPIQRKTINPTTHLFEKLLELIKE